MASSVWHIGNTTVRTPYRLKEALTILKNSEFAGNIVGKERENGFTALLHEKGIVRVERLEAEVKSDASDLGRKWRSALGQLGFITMPVTGPKRRRSADKEAGTNPYLFDDVPAVERPYEVTPNGNHLIHAQTTAEQQECFLRALAVYRIPSVFESNYPFPPFSPLRFVLQILLDLEKNGADPLIRYEEMAGIVQCRTFSDDIDQVVASILCYREQRKRSVNKKRFDKEKLGASVSSLTKVNSANTLIDYADVNFRYLKATGLFGAKGRAIMLLPEKRTLVDVLVGEKLELLRANEYAKRLWKGAVLPTDSREQTLKIIDDILHQLGEYGEEIQLPDIGSLSLNETRQHFFILDERLKHVKELKFAAQQAEQWKDIAHSLASFKDSKKKTIYLEGEALKVSSGEAPAYFEWIVWRAFLAMDSLVNMPWEARKFPIDQDFLPLSHAPGGGPDMIFVFEEFVLVVEVTLTASSRQEAAEGETVRRHVAAIAETYEKEDKRVYCLFIAIHIDSNTAETFKIGNWYKTDDTKLPLQIVPIPLEDFRLLFESIFDSGKIDPGHIKQLVTECRVWSNSDAPEWKKRISEEVRKYISKLIPR